ncbi:MAG: lipid-A-disaccharide synthase [Hyphomicrobiaceae bacterium]
MLRIFVVAGEHSGDRLGAKLIAALRQVTGGRVVFSGLGGDEMEAQGFQTLFDLADVAVMGPVAIAKRLPLLVRRVYRTVDAALSFGPDAVVIIDSPEFTHPIAKRIRKRRPDIPIVDYVSPSVWAWRPGRARKMTAYVDHVLALLPFEPEVHQRLGGPRCTYIGHPLVERREWIESRDGVALMARLGLPGDRPVVVVLPGSRPSEVSRLMQPFGDTVAALVARAGPVSVIIPTVESVRPMIAEAAQAWAEPPILVSGEEDKFAAFRRADVALAASGTVTLELAVAGTPMVVAYRVDRLALLLRPLVKVPSIVLANLVLGRNVFPEFIQERATPELLSAALAELLADTPARRLQQEALAGIGELMAPPASSPSTAAAEIVVRLARAISDTGASRRKHGAKGFNS